MKDCEVDKYSHVFYRENKVILTVMVIENSTDELFGMRGDDFENGLNELCWLLGFNCVYIHIIPDKIVLSSE